MASTQQTSYKGSRSPEPKPGSEVGEGAAQRGPGRKGGAGHSGFLWTTLTEWRLAPTPPQRFRGPGARRPPLLSRGGLRDPPAHSVKAGATTSAWRTAQSVSPLLRPTPPPKTTLPPGSDQSLSGIRGGSHPFNLLCPIQAHGLGKPHLHLPARAPAAVQLAGGSRPKAAQCFAEVLLSRLRPPTHARRQPETPSEWRATPLHVSARSAVSRLHLPRLIRWSSGPNPAFFGAEMPGSVTLATSS